MADPPALRQFGKYTVTGVAGAGGMGVVYEATDTVLGRTVALKLLPPAFADREESRERFLREAVTASSLDHPNIGTVYGIEEFDGQRAIVLAFYSGGSLYTRIKAGPLPPSQALAIAADIAAGLAAAHARGIVHRDIKPSNVLFGPNYLVKIVDFGLAKSHDASDITATGVASGTVGYMSPEQAMGGGIGPPSDVWALGVVLYEMLTGRRPFDGPTYAAVTQAILHHAPDLSAVPIGIAKLLERALARKPEDRYPSAREMLAALESVKGSVETAGEAPTRSITVAVRRSRRLPLKWLAAAAVVLAAAAALLLWKPHVRQVAVVALNPDPLASGLTSLLIGDLQAAAKGSRSLRVASPSEMERGDITTVTAARRKLGADLVLTVTLAREGDNLRALLSAVDAKGETVGATRTVSRPAADVARLEAELAAQAGDIMGIELAPRPNALASLQAAPGAYQSYVQAAGLLQGWKDRQNPDAAIPLLEQANQSAPGNAAVETALCQAYRLKFQRTSESRWLDAADRPCAAAPDADPKFVPAYIERGNWRKQRGDLPGAMKDLEQALVLDPPSETATQFLSEVYDLAGLHDKAEAIVRNAAAANPNSWSAQYALGEIYFRSGRLDEAARAYQRATDLAPGNNSAWTRLGSSFSKAERLPEAERAFLRSIAIAPSWPAYGNLGNLYLRQQRSLDAVGAYKKSLELNPKQQRAWGNLAAIYSRIPGKQEESRDAYRRAADLARETVKATPNDAVAVSDLASYLAFGGERAEPLTLIQKALALAPNDLEVLYNSAEVYEHLGFRDQALLWIRRMLDQGFPAKDFGRSPVLVELRKDSRFQSMAAGH